jgi:hypothetical protein
VYGSNGSTGRGGPIPASSITLVFVRGGTCGRRVPRHEPCDTSAEAVKQLVHVKQRLYEDFLKILTQPDFEPPTYDDKGDAPCREL